MVSPYPPSRDGIAQYAVQEVKRLRSEGHDVEVLSPGPSAAHHHLDLQGPRGVLALARRVSDYDRVIIQYHPDVFYPVACNPATHAAITSSLLAVARRARDLEIRIHEIDYDRGPRSPLDRLLWRSVPRIVLHTEAERARFASTFGVPVDSLTVADHGESFERRTELGRADARAALGVADSAFVFLCIGFIQPHKGFDRAVRAFAGLGGPDIRLDVVGSVRVEEPEYLDHADELGRLVAATPGATLHGGYTSDERFDEWIVASDVVVLPYRFIWSSGVLERARLYDRPVIATATGGLGDQAHDDVTLVGNDAELAVAMMDALGPRATVRPSAPWPVDGVSGAVDRGVVQAEIVARAAAERGAPVAFASDGTGRAHTAAPGGRSAALRRIAPLSLPSATSARPGVGALKRLVRRLTAWEVDPIVHQVNKLRNASIEVAETPPPEGNDSPDG